MNEDTQLRAITQELRTAGWTVVQDASPRQFDLPIDVATLDLVAKSAEPWPDETRPKLLIIEIPNRGRDVALADVLTGLTLVASSVAEESEALRRIEIIGAALEGLPATEVGFQIRFLDVSVDQAQARSLRKISTTDDALRGELELANATLADAAKREDGERRLLTAITWCRWLRILGIRFPARGHMELKMADLRTIQKDLYDAGIVAISPADYFEIHRSVIALTEGGDVEWRDFDRLASDLQRILKHVSDRLQKEMPSEPVPSRGRRGVQLFDLVETLIELSDPAHRDAMRSQLAELRATDGTPAYRQAVLDFEDLVPADDEYVRRELQRLRQLTRLIRN
jgi:hypothetical protein